MSYLDRLQSLVHEQAISPDEHRVRSLQIRELLMRRGVVAGGENFTQVHPRAIEAAFDAYDRMFFESCCRAALVESNSPIRFEFSKRMTRTGGMTVRKEFYEACQSQAASRRFEIKLSSTLLFQSFRDGRDVLVSGCRCGNRLDAMLRVVEHEMIHLIEMLVWYDSSCSQQRFQGIAQRFFGHTESTHQLLTPTEAAHSEYGISPGDAVVFQHQGRKLTGFVNRITRRATVLVADPRGEKFSDGNRYVRYYVPLPALQRAAAVS